jgi:hypothetical protein
MTVILRFRIAFFSTFFDFASAIRGLSVAAVLLMTTPISRAATGQDVSTPVSPSVVIEAARMPNVRTGWNQERRYGRPGFD